MLPAWATLVNGGAYGVYKSRAVRAVTGLLLVFFVIVGYAAGWQLLISGLALTLTVFVVVLLAGPGCVLLVNHASRNRRVWVSPGGRAVVTARRTKTGWRPDNASARPVRHEVAAPLLAQICDFADATSAVLSTHAANQRVAKLYRDRYGFDIHQSPCARPRVTRYPTLNNPGAQPT